MGSVYQQGEQSSAAPATGILMSAFSETTTVSCPLMAHLRPYALIPHNYFSSVIDRKTVTVSRHSQLTWIVKFLRISPEIHWQQHSGESNV